MPVGIVVALFAGFLVAQATAMWGGHDYLERTTGLTYAEYVHQGFGQLTVATFLTVVVVGLTMHVAARDTARDRLLLRVLLGALCVLTLAVVASALYRMSLYQDAFGYTVLRVFVDGFELWLGLVVVFLLVAGVRLSGWWVPRAVLVSAAVFALVFAAMNPDAWVAGRNIDRFEAGSSLDTGVPVDPRRRRDAGHRRAAARRDGVLHHGLGVGQARSRPTTGWRGTSAAAGPPPRATRCPRPPRPRRARPTRPTTTARDAGPAQALDAGPRRPRTRTPPAAT